MVFILFERKIFVVSVAFCVIKNHWVVPEIVLLLHSLLNISYSFYFPMDFPGLNIKSFRDLV